MIIVSCNPLFMGIEKKRKNESDCAIYQKHKILKHRGTACTVPTPIELFILCVVSLLAHCRSRLNVCVICSYVLPSVCRRFGLSLTSSYACPSRCVAARCRLEWIEKSYRQKVPNWNDSKLIIWCRVASQCIYHLKLDEKGAFVRPLV